MNTAAFNAGKRDREQDKPARNLEGFTAAERENYWRGRQASEKK